jgi:hypothetical protein
MDRSSVEIERESQWSYFCFAMRSDLLTPQLYVYNRETVIAEKFEAMVLLGIQTSMAIEICVDV